MGTRTTLENVEPKLGETLTFRRKKLKCVPHTKCSDCFCYTLELNCIQCIKLERTDKTAVMLVEINQKLKP